MGYPDDHEKLMISSYFQYLLIIISFSLLIMSTPTAADNDKYFNFLDDDKLITYVCETGSNISSNDYIQNVLSVVGNITKLAAKGEYGFGFRYGFPAVSGLAQCRDDVKGTECSTCLSNAVNSTNKICTSNNTKGVMFVQYKCFLMYTDQNFLGLPFIGFDKSSQNGPFCSGVNLTTNVRQLVVRSLFESLLNDTKRAPMMFKRGFNATADGSVVEAMVECRRDLNPEKCTTFLSDAATNLTRLCGAQTRGAYFLEGSYVRFAWKKN